MKNKKVHIILTAGGTGGHILPAVAVANALEAILGDQIEILFVGAEGKMEMNIVPEKGYKIIGLPIIGLQRRLTAKNLQFPIKLLKSIRKAKKIIKSFQPDAVIGFGGYASAPVLRAAQKRNIPTFIQEQNAFPGMVNRWLAKKTTNVFSAYENMETFFPAEKIIVTGNPIRKVFFDIPISQTAAKEKFALDRERPLIFVMGGSQGARSINHAIRENIDYFINNNISLIWQTGKWFIDEAKTLIKEKNADHLMKPTVFINDIHEAFAAADIVVSRAGAISIAELSAAQKPSIFVPLPIAAEDHQTKNAQQLVQADAAFMVEDKKVSSELITIIEQLLNNPIEMKGLSDKIKTFAKPNAATIIAQTILKQINVLTA